MMNERTQIGIKLVLSHVILLVGLLLLSILVETDSLLFLLVSQTILAILYLSGYWEFFGSRFRTMYAVSIEFGIIAILCWRIGRSSLVYNSFLTGVLLLVLLYLFFQLVKIVIVMIERGQKSVDIEFPLKNGTYLITDGGNSRVSRFMNYHFYSPIHRRNKTNMSMLYATDIVKLPKDQKLFLATSNNEYPIFGENVYSPMDGVVIKVVNDVPDNCPFSGDYPYNTGNTVVIRNKNTYLLLGHLKQNSIKVKVGDKILKNSLMGEIGNSGWSERPHLHMQMMESESDNYWHGIGIQMRFGKKNLYKNRKVECK